MQLPVFRLDLKSRFWLAEASAIIATVALTTLATAQILHLRDADLRVPLQYWAGGEVLVECAWIKTIAENGWYFANPRLSAPGTQEFYDFPLADSLHFAAIKVLHSLTSSWPLAMNLYYLAGFPLASLTTFVVLRQLSIRRPAAVVPSVLFAFAPYHFFRAQAHLQLSAYYLVPVAFLLAYWCWTGQTMCRLRRWRCSLTRKGWVTVGAGLLIGSAGVYYAFFACCFCLLASARLALRRRTLTSLFGLALVGGAITLGTAINVLPNLLYWLSHGANPAAASRYPHESELYGLKPIQLLLPVQHHRLPLLASVRNQYDRSSPLVNENSSTSLGLIGAAAFLFLLCVALLGTVPRYRPRLLVALATFTVGGLLLACIGGLGTVFSWLVTPQLRAYNRISIYLLMFALTAVGVFLDWCCRAAREGALMRGATVAALGLVLCFGLWDQSPAVDPSLYKLAASDFGADRAFFKAVEARFAGQGALLQLPHMSYPEHPPIVHLRDYEHFRAYLHTESLRFSYGAIRGRYWDGWLRDLVGGDVSPEALEVLALAGFVGILVDRLGYVDAGAATCRALEQILGRPVLSGKRYVCYGLSAIGDKIKARSDASWAGERLEAVLFPVQLRWHGFHGREASAESMWRWAPWRAELILDNPGACARSLEMTLNLLAGAPSGCRLTISGPAFRQVLTLDARVPRRIHASIELPPGRSRIWFRAEGERLVAPGDPRILVFRVENPTFRVVSEPAPVTSNRLLRPRVVEAN